MARRCFAALGALLLIVPLLLSVGPRPNEAMAQYIAGLTGTTLCLPSNAAGHDGQETPHGPVEHCALVMHCAACGSIAPTLFALLSPQRILSGAMLAEPQSLKAQHLLVDRAARDPPTLF
ncbi:MAG: hypothetical protein ACRCU5_11125 [Rhizobiaceae bacterium]